MNHYLKVFLLSMTPIIEQRGAIPVGFLYDMNPIYIFLVAFIGSLIPAPFILLLFKKIYNYIRPKPFFRKLVNIIDNKIDRNKDSFIIKKELALIIFVGLPLPTTGVWTGSAVAAFLGLDFKKSMLWVTIGAFISAVVITTLSFLIPGIFKAVML